MNTTKTLYLFVNCCREQTRFDVAKEVIHHLNVEQKNRGINLDHDLIAFDNGSTHPDSVKLLKDNFSQVVTSSTNNGYWSAIHHVLSNLKQLKADSERFKYIHIIESDHTYYALHKIKDCENVLESDDDLGSIRMAEYDIVNKHLYDKTLNREDGKRYAWVSHINHVTRESVFIEPLVDNVYRTNFLTCLHSLNRLESMIDIFDQLAKMGDFTENDFQRFYHEKYPVIGQLDGGVFHAKLGCTLEKDVISGSWSKNLKDIGYRTTRVDRIIRYLSSNVIL